MQNKKQVWIAGGSGLIGNRLIDLIDKEKYEITILSRSNRKDPRVNYCQWNLDEFRIHHENLKAPDYIINLAGAGIADKKWTPERKRVILESRTKSNALLAKYIEEHAPNLEAYISASAIGVYGDRSDELLTVESTPGTKGFLSQCTIAWEASIQKLESLVKRLVMVRVGIVLSTKGGALKEILFPAKLGSAGYFGNGKQYFSWIHIDDVSNIFIAAIENEQMVGIYNGVGPNPIPIKSFSKALAKAVSGIQIVHPIPKFVLRMMLGEREELMLNSTRVFPNRLRDMEFDFGFEEAEVAVRDLLDREI